MKTVIEYFNTYTFIDILSIIFWICAIVLCIEKFIKWCLDKFLQMYNKKKGKEDDKTALQKHTSELKTLTTRIDELANLMNLQYQHLEKKIDRASQKVKDFEEMGKRRDAAILRDRIIQAIRFFGNNVDENGDVYVNVSDHENLTHLFEEYFSCGGNGTVKAMYKNEFKNWKIKR